MTRPLADYRRLAHDRLQDLDAATRQYHTEVATRANVASNLAVLEQAQGICQAVAQQVQQQAHERIASVVTKSLQAVFDDPYEFRIHFERKRGRTEARLVFERGGEEIDPMEASGGGPVDVASFALRLSCMMLSRPPIRRLLVLDEPFKFVSPNLRDRVRRLIEGLSEEFGIQIIMVTHMDELRAGEIIEIK